MSETAYEPTYIEAVSAADHLGLSDSSLGYALATSAARLLREHADRIERQRDNTMKDIYVGDFDEHIEEPRAFFIAALAAFEASRKSDS
jgi:hypothetical protein